MFGKPNELVTKSGLLKIAQRVLQLLALVAIDDAGLGCGGI
ncbi:hypothetical protein X773_24890 [Mesorhizobium sp. LSJC285A00]|nr:hypothetical protein X773_24890 [Mesorhizobium sp. LSJC285A00]ESY18680.1 hypothetical protein X751_16215 [Mesorhizobium sp. LNJC395A00]